MTFPTNNKKQTYLVAWSGGLDSTYLVWKLLCDGHKVYTVYTNITNNTNKSNRESKAIGEIANILSKYNHTHLGTNEIGLNVMKNNIMLKQVLPFLTSLYYACDNQNIDHVCLGYVLNDDAISFLPEITRVWKSFSGLTRGTLPKISFPLSKTSKEDMHRELPNDIKDYITWCESEYVPDHCGECKPCTRMNNTTTWKTTIEWNKTNIEELPKCQTKPKTKSKNSQHKQ